MPVIRNLGRAATPLRLAAVMTLVLTGLQLATSTGTSAAAGSTVRINAGGPAQTVNGVSWAGCAQAASCNGYVRGGFPWAESTAVSGFPADTNAAMHRTEWTGGETNGVAAGAVAFAFDVPVAANNDYDVTLEFTELNKTAAGQRLFDVRIDGTTRLSGFDVFQQAGGAGRTITRTFRVSDTDGAITIDFVRRVENAKVDAIAIVPAPSAGTTTTTTTRPPVAITGTQVAWTDLARPPYRTVEAAGGIIGNKLYKFGGFQQDSGFYTPRNSASVYDIATNRWSSLPPVPRGITHAARVIDGNRFILLGAVAAQTGGGETFGIRTVFTFNTTNNTWATLPDLPAARGSGGAALIGRQLHFLGGIDTNRVEKTDHWVLDLDDIAAGWRTAPSMPVGRSHFAVVGVGNSIYTIGGMSGWEGSTVERAEVYRYDTASRTWTRQANLPAPRSHMGEAAMEIDGRIWVLGGEPQYPDSTRDIFVYNLANNTWARANAQLPQARFAGVAGHIGNTIYYVDGSVYADGAWRGAIS